MAKKEEVNSDPFNEGEVLVRDYTLLNEDSFMSPKEEEEKFNEEKQINMQKKNHKNYTFNNCTVTINEEGKAINILEEKARNETRNSQAMMELSKGVMTTIQSVTDHFVKAREERLKNPQPKPSAEKKVPVKKSTKTSKSDLGTTSHGDKVEVPLGGFRSPKKGVKKPVKKLSKKR